MYHANICSPPTLTNIQFLSFPFLDCISIVPLYHKTFCLFCCLFASNYLSFVVGICRYLDLSFPTPFNRHLIFPFTTLLLFTFLSLALFIPSKYYQTTILQCILTIHIQFSPLPLVRVFRLFRNRNRRKMIFIIINEPLLLLLLLLVISISR